MKFEDQPINCIQWLNVDDLVPNEWNPNHVLSPELKLIKLSLLMQGWIQPVLVNREWGPSTSHVVGDDTIATADMKVRYEIIDGFHRSTLTKTDKEVRALTDGRVPAAVLDLPVHERMMLTVRINRAKGTHQASLMSDLVKSLVVDMEIPVETVARGIGATKHEVDTLLLDDVFKRLKVEDHAYSRAWRPKMAGEK